MIPNIIKRLHSFIGFIRYGDFIWMDASSICQLKCPVCVDWQIREGLGKGYLKFKDFKCFVDKNPYFKNIELSNSGEIFLNPELKDILKYAYQKNISMSANNGVNMNSVDEETLKCIVKYRFKSISLSIDGADQETYAKYRVGGKFNRVIDNINKINRYKRIFNSPYPKMIWQFIIFGHNEHEISVAENIAKELKMEFRPLFNMEPDYSPASDDPNIQKIMGMSYKEYEERVKPLIRASICKQLWDSPVINWDGKLLGCCFNIQPFPYNLFESDYSQVINGERYIYAKRMLKGEVKEREDIPCTTCDVYQWRKAHNRYISIIDVYSLYIKRIIRNIVPLTIIKLIKSAKKAIKRK